MSEDVSAFAGERGVAEFVAPALALAERIFPEGEVVAYLEHDSEIAGLQWIVLEVATHGLSAEQILERQLRWTAEIVDLCPPSVRESFILGLR